MDLIRRLLQTEPAVTIGLVAAGLTLLSVFGVHFGDGQVDAIKNFVTAALLFGGAIFGIRQSVYSPKSVTEIIDAEHEADAASYQ